MCVCQEVSVNLSPASTSRYPPDILPTIIPDILHYIRLTGSPQCGFLFVFHEEGLRGSDKYCIGNLKKIWHIKK